MPRQAPGSLFRHAGILDFLLPKFRDVLPETDPRCDVLERTGGVLDGNQYQYDHTLREWVLIGPIDPHRPAPPANIVEIDPEEGA